MLSGARGQSRPKNSLTGHLPWTEAGQLEESKQTYCNYRLISQGHFQFAKKGLQ